MLSFQNVTRNFHLDDATTITPVKDVSLDINRGDFVIIFGRSGTGKTTFLNLAAGLIKPSSGKVKMDSQDLSEMSDGQLSSLRSQKIGFVFQFPSLLPALTVKENLCVPAELSGRNNASAKAMMLLEMVGLAGKKDVYPRHLSAGEQKRIVLARALINEPQLILADEPSSDLDDRTENEVMGILRDYNGKGVTFLVVSHNTQLLTFANRAFQMENGRLDKIK